MSQPTNHSTNKKDERSVQSRNTWSGIMFGIGLVAFMDEAVFHQILHWHHFYDKTTTAMGLVSDGIFHSFSWFATVAGLFMVAGLRRQLAWLPRNWLAGLLVGAGGFQLYDGTIQHKLMGLHQIRYDVNIFPYDMVWYITSIIILVLGIILLIKSKQRTGAT